jgi:hypothetical protein
MSTEHFSAVTADFETVSLQGQTLKDVRSGGTERDLAGPSSAPTSSFSSPARSNVMQWAIKNFPDDIDDDEDGQVREAEKMLLTDLKTVKNSIKDELPKRWDSAVTPDPSSLIAFKFTGPTLSFWGILSFRQRLMVC